MKVEIEQQDRESMNFEEMVQRVVNVEAKVGLRSSTMVKDSDIRCPKGHRPFNITISKVHTLETTAKDFQPEEPKVKKVKSTLSRAVKANKPSDQVRKKKKSKRHPQRQDKKEQTSASTTNATEVQQKKKKKNWDRNISKVICYNCNKKSHYANTCTKLKNYRRSWQYLYQ